MKKIEQSELKFVKKKGLNKKRIKTVFGLDNKYYYCNYILPQQTAFSLYRIGEWSFPTWTLYTALGVYE